MRTKQAPILAFCAVLFSAPTVTASELTCGASHLHACKQLLLQRENRLEEEHSRLRKERDDLQLVLQQVQDQISRVNARMATIDSALNRTDGHIKSVELAISHVSH